MLDYLAVTIKGLAPDDVIEKILILPKDKFVLNEWGINKYQRHYAFSEIKVYFNKDRGAVNMKNTWKAMSIIG